ncbi:Sorting nexin-6-like [Oopsacas minuta]|uniref:Sorting nexin-6-like n=1 Tax=Oopsacas minuta TaxID=111878 RepID=A0AAV7JIE0_9METZ|nr:Sorting nexin-6-like [Oopsacas minuta]
MATEDHKPGLMNSVQRVKGRREGKTTIFMEIGVIYNTELVVYRLYEDLRWMFIELSKTVLNGPYMGCILPPLPKIPSPVFHPGSILREHYLQGFCLATQVFLELIVQHPKFSQESCVQRFFSQEKLPTVPASSIGSSIKEEASKMFGSIQFRSTQDPDKNFVEYQQSLSKYYDVIRGCFVLYSTKCKSNERIIQSSIQFSKETSQFSNELFFKDSPKEYNILGFLEEYLDFSRANLESAFVEVDQNIYLFFEYYTSYTLAALNMLQRRQKKLETIAQLSKKTKDFTKTAELLDRAHDELDSITRMGESDLMLLQHQKTMALYNLLSKAKHYHVTKTRENITRLKDLISEMENIEL